MTKRPPSLESSFPQDETGSIPLPDASFLDAEEAAILKSLTDQATGFESLRKQAQSRLRKAQSSLEFRVDHLSDSIHKLEQRVSTAGREADRVLSTSAARLKERDEKEKRAAGTKDLPVMEVLRSLGRILPEGDG